MYLRVFHQTHYFYRAPITGSYNEVRLQPGLAADHDVEFFLLNIFPPVRLRHFCDDHQNHVHWFELPDPHTELRVEASVRIRTSSRYADGLPSPVDFATLAASTGSEPSLRPFLEESHYVSMEAEFRSAALEIRGELDDVFSTALAVMEHLSLTWRYDPDATHAATPVREAMAGKAGVCQDFAHAMLSLCRSLGIPARYVSGYVYDATGAMRGAQASHAWCEIYLPDQGWFGFDPTNRCLADERHVSVATGRDYDDAAPIRGRLLGPENATVALKVAVEIERLD